VSAGDRIELRGLRVLAICGVLPSEQEAAQPLEVDLDIVADLGAAGASDALSDTVDYGEVCATVATVAASGRFALLERFAAVVAEKVLATPMVDEVEVAVRKLRPPVPQLLETSGVRIRRSRPDAP
jgi:dihydroneopterin aldolase